MLQVSDSSYSGVYHDYSESHSLMRAVVGSGLGGVMSSLAKSPKSVVLLCATQIF